MKIRVFKKTPVTNERIIYAVFQQEPNTLDEPLIGLFASEQQAKAYAANQEATLPEFRTSWEEIVVTLGHNKTLADGQIIHLLISGQPERAKEGLPDMFAEIEGAYTSESEAQQILNKLREEAEIHSYSQAIFNKNDSQKNQAPSIADITYIRPVPLGWHSESPWNQH